ncbi:MAG TPA: glycerol kinase GlpK [Rhodocyclaceae bacterium]|nr:glycerol kinase GlpK [Rhodocyclaceae bacterium]
MSSERFILALDQGTSSSRAMLFDAEGNIRGRAQREFGQHFPQPGWVEHDPEEIWASQIAAAREALAASGASAAAVAAIGVANQRETVVLWERESGRALAPAIVWQDRRTAGMCEELAAAGLAPLFQQKTGLLLDPYFSGTKLKWLLDHIPGSRTRAARGELAAGTIDTWLAWKLTGGGIHVTDVSNASRTLLYNLRTREWDEELLRLLDVPRELLPEVRPSSEVYGLCDAGWLGAALPIAGIAGDQQAATFGQACWQPGMVKNTYGTGCFMLMNTGGDIVPSHHRLLTTAAWQIGGETRYALEGSVFMAGATVQWLRDGLGLIARAEEVEALAASVPDNGGVYLVPAFAGLGAPHWEPHARGSLFGLTRGSGRAHIARAALEAIAYQSADVLRAMERDADMAVSELRVDGGAANNDLLMQFQADILGVSVVRPRITETTALGAAYLAGLAVGFWRSTGELASHWQTDRRFEPAMPESERDRLIGGWNLAVAQTIAWARAQS